jgi:hypothetical protein
MGKGYSKGRRPLGKTPGGGNYGEKWHQKLDYLPKPKKGPKEIRLVGGAFTIFQHYVRFKRKDGSKGGFYEVCPDFNWETGEFRKGPEARCPLCADFSDQELPQELRLLGSFRYYMDAFDVSAAKSGNKEGIFGVIFTNKYGRNDLATIADITGADLDDLKKGHTVFWNQNDQAKDPKERTRFYQGTKLPVQWDDEKELFLLKGGGLKFIGEPTDFEEIIEVKDPEEIRSDLKRLGLYQRLEEVLEISASRNEPVTDRGHAEDDESAGSGWGGDDEEEEEEEEEPKKKKKPPKKKPAKKKPAKKKKKKAEAEEEEEEEEEDASWGDEDGEEEEETESPPEEGAWGGDEEEEDSWGDDGEEEGEEEEEEKPKKKPPKKKPAKKKPAKKKKKKKDDEEYDNSFFGDEEEGEEEGGGWGDDADAGKSDAEEDADPDAW